MVPSARKVVSRLAGKDSKYHSRIDEQMRRGWNVEMARELQVMISDRLMESKSELEKNFETELSELEAPQLLIYKTGDFFKTHRDKSPKKEEHPRRVSLVLFLNNGGHDWNTDVYQGGQLYLYEQGGPENPETVSIRGVRGTLVAFRSDILHEVRPVLSGERITIVSWFH
ncbi:MAG TPA: 2OG-Fe(II) oxygenase [Acidobacteriota bacterium]|nr:2OG-Fe(II) oxygenase [Acidobacteriota bacterium]